MMCLYNLYFDITILVYAYETYFAKHKSRRGNDQWPSMSLLGILPYQELHMYREVALFRETMYRYGSSWGWLLHVCNTFCYKLEFGLFRLALLQLFTQLCNFSNIVNSNIHNLIKRRRVISPSRKK